MVSPLGRNRGDDHHALVGRGRRPSPSDAWSDACAKIDRYVACVSRFAVASDPATYAVYECGDPRETLAIDRRAVADA